MGRMFRAFGIGAITLMAVACARSSTVTTEVVRFHSLPKDSGSPTTQAKSFYVFPTKKQAGDLEYTTYAASVSRRLESLGYRKARNLSSADYAIVIGYGISGRSQVTEPVWGMTGGDTIYHSGTVSSGGAFGSYSGTSTTPLNYDVVGSRTSTVHHKWFMLLMYDKEKSAGRKPVSVYKGTVNSTSSSGSFSAVSECLFDALFKNFYKTGTQKINLRMSRCNVKK